MFRLILFSILAFFVQSCIGQDTANCTAAVQSCLQIGVDASSGNETAQWKCSKYNETFQCLKNLSCVAAEYLRVIYVNSADKLKNLTCDLTNDVYPNTTADGCTPKQRSCLFKYVDNLVELNKNTNSSLAVCLELSNYAQCHWNNTGCIDATQVASIVSSEQTRTRISSPCVIPSLKGSLTNEECSSAISQCRTIVDLRPNSSNVCQKTQEASQCIVDLNCASDVLLRLLNVQYSKNLSTSAPSCEINSIYPLEKANLTECKQARRNCTYPYVTALMNSGNDATKLCTEHNTYIACLSKATSCINMDELKKISSDELVRMKINTGCIVTTFNAGTTLAWSWLPLASALLYYQFFI